MQKIKTINLKNHKQLLVEVLEIEIPSNFKINNNTSHLPDGAEDIGVIDDVLDSMESLREQVASIALSIKDGFKENTPDEFSVEVGIGFAGKGAIPFIVSAKSNANLKIKATWKKDS